MALRRSRQIEKEDDELCRRQSSWYVTIFRSEFLHVQIRMCRLAPLMASSKRSRPRWQSENLQRYSLCRSPRRFTAMEGAATAPSWTGVRKAVDYPKRAMQGRIYDDMVFNDNGPSEDAVSEFMDAGKTRRPNCRLWFGSMEEALPRDRLPNRGRTQEIFERRGDGREPQLSIRCVRPLAILNSQRSRTQCIGQLWAFGSGCSA